MFLLAISGFLEFFFFLQMVKQFSSCTQIDPLEVHFHRAPLPYKGSKAALLLDQKDLKLRFWLCLCVCQNYIICSLSESLVEMETGAAVPCALL